ncbi:MAG TPA: A24 family peptidase [Acidimicrobiia bacterium]|nr:A24 family peptidase [Acidimicrobiia bacterium]
MTYVLVGAAGFLLGLVSHDVAIQSLQDQTPLRPLTGTCPRCRHDRGWLRFRCPDCGRLAIREVLVAIIGAIVAVGMLNTLGVGWELLAYLGFLGLTLALVVTDLEEFRIVDRLNLPGTVILALVLTVVALTIGAADALLRAVGGAAAYFVGSSLLFMAAGGRGFGAGDVKLSVQLGLFTAYLGWSVLGWAVFATALIGGALALAMVIAGGAGRKTELPYGPPMILGAWTVIVLVGVGAIPVPS